MDGWKAFSEDKIALKQQAVDMLPRVATIAQEGKLEAIEAHTKFKNT